MNLKKDSDKIILGAVVLAAAAMRLYHFSSWSLMNDELSAWQRTHVSGLGELFEKGVRPDFHPAGVQIFLYFWTQVVGDSVFIMRLPFVLAGIASVYFAYRIAKKWFGISTAMLSSVALAILQYPVLYSQVARPYSTGLLFALMLVWFWHLILFEKQEQSRRFIVAGFAVSFALCAYDHYFCLLFALIVTCTGLLYANKNNFKPYLLGCFIGTVLYLPHLPITYEQVSRGGLESWLSKPGEDYIWSFLSYAFNDSTVVMISVAAFVCFSLAVNYRKIPFSRFQLICIGWFAALFLIGYYYSVYLHPVLQYSILIFAFPFLLIAVFSFFTPADKKYALVLAPLLAGVLFWSTVFEKKIYTTTHFGVFKEIAERTVEWKDRYGADQVSIQINMIAPEYIDYYYSKMGAKMKFSFYRSDERASMGRLMESVNESNSRYLAYGWSNVYDPPGFEQYIRIKYPKVVERHSYFNSEVVLFERDEHSARPVLFNTVDGLDQYDRHWKNDSSRIDTIHAFSGKKAYHFKEGDEFGCNFSAKLSDIVPDTSVSRCIEIGARFFGGKDVQLVMELHSKDSLYEWHSAIASNFPFHKNEWGEVFYAEKLPQRASPDDRVNVYVWNNGKKELFADDIYVRTYDNRK